MNTLETARELTNDQLIQSMKEGFTASSEGVRQACIAIAVLEERDVDLPMLPEVYRYARDIAEGKLSAHAGLILGRHSFLIKAVLGLPIAEQDRIADGAKIKVAVKVAGRVMYKDLTIFEMSQPQLRMVFSEDGITSHQDQGEWLHKSGYVEPVPEAKKTSIAVDAKTSEIVIGRVRLTVDDLIPALSSLGYVVKSSYGTKKITPVKVV